VEQFACFFGRLQHYFVVNTSVNYINEFVTQLALPSNKIKNSLFHLQNHARTLYLNVNFCKNSCTDSPKFWHNSTKVSVNFIFITCL